MMQGGKKVAQNLWNRAMSVGPLLSPRLINQGQPNYVQKVEGVPMKEQGQSAQALQNF